MYALVVPGKQLLKQMRGVSSGSSRKAAAEADEKCNALVAAGRQLLKRMRGVSPGSSRKAAAEADERCKLW